MIRVFSSCMSIDDMDKVREMKFVEKPHLLGPGVDLFTEDGTPLRPKLKAEHLSKAFSGSSLDLSAYNINESSSQTSTSPSGLSNGSNQEQNSLNNAYSPVSQVSLTSNGVGKSSNNRPGGGLGNSDLGNISAGASLDSQQQGFLSNVSRMMRAKASVLVIGASGFLGCHIVSTLLNANYEVLAVLNTWDPSVVAELFALNPDSKKRLSVREIDIFNSVSFKSVLQNGFRYIVHCGVSGASTKATVDVVKAHTDVANALFEAIRQYSNSNVKRVVVIGSAYILGHPSVKVINEDCQNARLSVSADSNTYARQVFVNESVRLSKIVGVELVVLLPTIMLGPSYTREVSEGVNIVNDLSSSSRYFPFAPRIYRNFVDVRDVADSVLNSISVEEAKDEMFIIGNQTKSLAELGKVIRQTHPQLTAPIYNAPNLFTLLLIALTSPKSLKSTQYKNLSTRREFNSSKAEKVLNLKQRPFEITIRDTIDDRIKQHNLLNEENKLTSRSLSLSTTVISLGALVVVFTAIGVGINFFKKNRK